MQTARLFAAALFAAVSAHAADGDPDTGFAGGAVATQSVNAPYYQLYEPAAALGEDGSIAVIGAAGVGANSVASRFAIAKFRSDGSADPGFGSLGVATVDFSGGAADYPAYGRGIARLADGGWLVAGRVGAAHDVGVARLRADGQLDAGYADQGRLSFDLGGQENLLDLQVDAQQRAWLLVARSGGVTLARLTPAGAFDTGFGDGGRLALANDISVLGFALDGQGRILLGGTHYGQVNYEMAVRRLRADGSLDGSFGSQGLTLVTPDLRAGAQKLAVLADGRILAVGNSSGGASTANIGRMTAVRLLDNGQLDASYGSGGVRVIDFAGEERSTSYPDTRIALGADGKLTIARSVIDPVAAIRLARLLPNGQPDAGFAPDGKRTALQGSYYMQTLARVFATPTRLLIAGVYNQNSQRTFYATAWRDGDSIFRADLP